jgi:hypothetical protein
LTNVVQPVSIVDSDITLSTTSGTPLMDTSFSAGLLVGPAAATVIADTGAQLAGNYFAVVMFSGTEVVNGLSGINLARRNAANAADIWTQSFFANPGALNQVFVIRLILQTNERLRMTVGPSAFTGDVSGNIFLIAG